MNGMFSYASSFNQPLAQWNVSSVTNMSGNQPVTRAADVVSFNQPLAQPTALAYNFNQDMSSWSREKRI